MIRQITAAEAVRRLEAGETIKCLVPGERGTWESCTPMDFEDYISDVICFAMEAAEEETAETEEDPEEETEEAPAEEKTEAQQEPQAVKINGHATRRRKKDADKIRLLYKQGWSEQKIADEMDSTYATIHKYIQDMKTRGEL